jgi:hypothetical protein
MTDERKAFEAWGLRRHLPSAMERSPHYPEQYKNSAVQSEWEAWRARAAVAPPRERGGVVVTTNERGECIAVTRQDDEGRILSTIWLRAALRATEKP